MSWVASNPSTVTWSGTGGTSATWTASLGSAATWTASTGDDATWSGSTVPVVPPAWTMGSPVTDGDGGADFVATLSDQFPWYLTEDRPLVLRDTYTDI